MPEIPNHYPDWVKEFFLAETEYLPGFIGDWWDCAVRFEEDDDSITVYDMTDMGGDEPDEVSGIENVKLATFYGNQHVRRIAALQYLGKVIVFQTCAEALQGNPIPEVFRQMVELPVRLAWSESYGNKVFGGPWE